jgi:amidase
MRPTVGIASPKGIVPMGRSFDTPGPLAKDTRDLADLLTVLVDSNKTKVPTGGYISAVDPSWEGIKLGTLDPRKWQYPEGLLGYNPKAMDQIVRLIGQHRLYKLLANTRALDL